MPENSLVWQRGGSAQEVWRAVHERAAIYGLSGEQIGTLRSWASSRMRDLPFAVWETDSFVVRPSFGDAIKQAALEILDGRVPE